MPEQSCSFCPRPAVYLLHNADACRRHAARALDVALVDSDLPVRVERADYDPEGGATDGDA